MAHTQHQDVGFVPGGRLARALFAWLMTAAIAVGATFAVGASVVPASDGTTKALTAISVFEVYALLIGSLYVSLGGTTGLVGLLRYRFTSSRDLGLMVAVGSLTWAGAALAYIAVDSHGALLDALAWLGTDGGRIGAIDPFSTGLSLLRACLLAPFGEELLFRGALFGWLRGHAGAWPTIIITAALFAVVHVLPILMPLAFTLGIALGWVRERTGSTWPGATFHVVQNAGLMTVVYAATGWH